jgi:hypothetical protein
MKFSVGAMVLKLLLLLSVLCVGCLAYLAPGSRIRTHSSIMNPPSRMLAQGIRMQPSSDAISVRVESHKPSTNQIITKTLVSLHIFEILWSSSMYLSSSYLVIMIDCYCFGVYTLHLFLPS